MPYNPDIHNRRSIRLKGYKYTQPGAYFVTICTHQRQCLFGEIISEKMHPNLCGQVVVACWQKISDHFSHVALDEFVLMPNHWHGIIVIKDWIENKQEIQFPMQGSMNSEISEEYPRPLLGTIVRNFKSVSARKVNQINRSSGISIWQRNYYEHIIRDEAALINIREYIMMNPSRWDSDRENPLNT